tara:strand:- start:815 stop:1039 length:225 start_codon:yes stop_codon:yes gene_type:complete
MRIKYLRKVSVNDIFKCQICGEIGREQYIATPSIPALVDWKELIVCKKCARREVGNKNKKGWDRIHERTISGRD